MREALLDERDQFRVNESAAKAVAGRLGGEPCDQRPVPEFSRLCLRVAEYLPALSQPTRRV